MAQGVFVITEQIDGEFRKVSYEAVSEALKALPQNSENTVPIK
jgi:hypothetical protein